MPPAKEIRIMVRWSLKMVAAVIALVLTFVWTAHAESPKTPSIMSAVVSVDQSTLFVTGANFGRTPIVRLDGLDLGGVSVDPTGRQLVAVMPALQPGSYRLEVVVGSYTCD